MASVQHCPAISVAETLAGVPGIVDLWYWFYETELDPALVDAGVELMAADERARYMRFRFERDRRLFLATRLLVRTVLSRYARVAPADWRFAAGRSGKPRIESPAPAPSLHFNLANTPGLVVCAVSVAHERIGVDVERIDREAEFMGLADRYFSVPEARALGARAAAERPRRFFEYWTLKESYVKARGIGLALPLDRFTFTIDDDRVSVAFDARAEDDESCWRFTLIDAPPSHLVAIGANTGGGVLSVRASQLVPADFARRP